MLNAKAIQIATLSLVNPSVDAIALAMSTTKLAVLGSYASLKKEGLAIYENGNIVLTDAGNKQFNAVVADESDLEIADLINMLGVEVETISIKEGTRKAIYHEIVENNPGLAKSALNKLLQAATGLSRRPCYVIQYNYEKALGLHN